MNNPLLERVPEPAVVQKQPVSPEYLRSRQELGQQVLVTDNIWTAIEQLTEGLGMRVGQHLETLLSRFSVEAHQHGEQLGAAHARTAGR